MVSRSGWVCPAAGMEAIRPAGRLTTSCICRRSCGWRDRRLKLRALRRLALVFSFFFGLEKLSDLDFHRFERTGDLVRCVYAYLVSPCTGDLCDKCSRHKTYLSIPFKQRHQWHHSHSPTLALPTPTSPIPHPGPAFVHLSSLRNYIKQAYLRPTDAWESPQVAEILRAHHSFSFPTGNPHSAHQPQQCSHAIRLHGLIACGAGGVECRVVVRQYAERG